MPEQIYAARVARFDQIHAALTTRWNRLANLRVVVFLLTIAAFVLALRQHLWLLAIIGVLLLIGFLLLVRQHSQLGRLRQQAATRRNLNQEALQRLARDWQALPLLSNAQAPANHPYAADLDIFGRASLFHLLFAGGTVRGEQTLRDWLLTFADPTTITTRQAAVQEFARQIDLREDLQMAGRLSPTTRRDPEPFLAWAEGSPWLQPRTALVWLSRLLPIAFWLTLALWLTGVVTFPLWIVCFLGNITLNILLSGQINSRLNRLVEQQSAFQVYASSLAVLAPASFTSPLLLRLHTELRAEGRSAAAQMHRLARLCNLILPPGALANVMLQPFFLWNCHVLWALEQWQQQAGRHARHWLAVLGEVEALAALGGLAHAQPAWAFPSVTANTDAYTATALGHPLLANTARVPNDITVGPPGTFLLVTGSNMSGKSTLLRAIGTNAVLAGAGGPVCATLLQLPPVMLWTSMRVQDSLAQGVSYYMAELRRLKAVVDGAHAAHTSQDRLPLYLLDEILQGTNTTERQIAARRIIVHLVHEGAIGAISTHDLQLADSPELAATAQPIHFTETFTTGPAGPTMTFDYQVRPGIATSTNALRLMEIVGLDLDSPGATR